MDEEIVQMTSKQLKEMREDIIKEYELEHERLVEEYDPSFDDVIDEVFELDSKKSKIRKDKKKGDYSTFHELLLKGELSIYDTFTIDILCKRKNKKEIIKCTKCIIHEKCPKRSLINKIKDRHRAWTIEKYDKIESEIVEFLNLYNSIRESDKVGYESFKSYTMKKMQLGTEKFDAYYQMRGMNIIQALRFFFEKNSKKKSPLE